MGEKVYGYGRKFRKGIQIQDQDLWYISIHHYRMLLLLGSLSPGGAKRGLMGKASQPAKREVIKHSAAIQIENNITLLQRRTWNALLYNAYDELETKEEHAIPKRNLLASSATTAMTWVI